MDGNAVGAPSSFSTSTFSDVAFMRNGVAPSAIGYDSSLPQAGRPLKLNTPRYTVDEEAVRAILSLLLHEHGEAMRRAGEEIDEDMIKRWLQPRGGDARATLQALRTHVAWRTDPEGPFLSSSNSPNLPADSSAATTPRERRRSGSGDGGDRGLNLPPRSRTPRPTVTPPRGLLPAACVGRVDPRSIAPCLAARKACLQGTDSVGRAVVLIRASRHTMGTGSTV